MANVRVSLGIVAWQVICRGVPYNIQKFVDSDNIDLREIIRDYLAKEVDPGDFFGRRSRISS